MSFKLQEEKDPIMVTGPGQLVEFLNRKSKFPESDSQTFMLQYAKRAVLFNNEDIRATDPESFVEDLIKLGHIERVT